MRLLDELIMLSSNESSSTVEILRKCLILGHQLKNQTLVSWANAELNGYRDDADLPPYRTIYIGAKGNFSGPFGSAIRNLPIAPYLLEEKHRRLAEYVELREAIANYEELMRSNSKHFEMPWPQDLVLYYQDRLQTQNGCVIVQAWQSIGRNAFAQVFDAVKNRTLALCLELQGEVSEEAVVDPKVPAVAEQIQKSVTNNIYGGVNVIASDQSKVDRSTMQIHQSGPAITLETLQSTLKQAGFDATETEQLRAAIEEDKPVSFGKRTQAWISAAAPKFLVNGAKVAAPIAREIVTGLVKQHLGLQ